MLRRLALAALAAVAVLSSALVAQTQGELHIRVTLTDTTGKIRSVVSNGFGYFRFGGLQVGQTYTISVESRRWAVAPLTVSVIGQEQNFDLIAAQ